jgi:hypothetical protein
VVDLGPRPRPGREPAHGASAPSPSSSATAACARSGGARARRWLAPPLAGFTSVLLLPATLALD